MNTKKIIAGALIGGAAIMGISVGAGHAEAKMEPGLYKHQGYWHQFPIFPESNVKIVGDKMYSDVYGITPMQGPSTIFPRKNGGTVSTADNPVALWAGRTDYTKTPYGYLGNTYTYGIPSIGSTLTKVD
ncbi:hypothetical protein V1Y59_15125 [Gordonia sp. PKS22-38]|uniref:MspA protein n=1 Tax=Gordonia prachuapensis TaxID=3115651 RepID=A0ABU7MWC0_9ACTN|nr:hypothetical protein [Gordonia sp. PKS22-38]